MALAKPVTASSRAKKAEDVHQAEVVIRKDSIGRARDHSEVQDGAADSKRKVVELGKDLGRVTGSSLPPDRLFHSF